MSIYSFFSLVNTQARLSLKAEASKLYLSYLWWVLEPILFVIVFYFVFEILLKTGRDDYLLFLICGKIPFLWFSKSVLLASNSIVQNRGLINQVNIPKAVFPYVSVQEALYKQWIVFLVLFLFVMGYGRSPTINWLWLIPLIFVQYLLILVCSLMGALFVSFVADMRMIIAMGVTFLLFASGVFWDVGLIENSELRQQLIVYNPLAFLLDGYREVIMNHSVYDVTHLLKMGVLVAMVLVVVHWAYSRMSKVVAARVLNS